MHSLLEYNHESAVERSIPTGSTLTLCRRHYWCSSLLPCRVESKRGAVVVGTAYLLTGPFGFRCLSSRAMTLFPRSAHRTVHANFPHTALGQGTHADTSLWHVAPPVASGYCLELLGFPISYPLPLLTPTLNQGRFPPPELPGFVGTTSPSATPSRPACPSRASGWPLRSATPRGFPCCIGLPLSCMLSPLPRRNLWVLVSLASPVTATFLSF